MSLKKGPLECPACKGTYINLCKDLDEGALILMVDFKFTNGNFPIPGAHCSCESCGYNAGLPLILGYNSVKQEAEELDE